MSLMSFPAPEAQKEMNKRQRLETEVIEIKDDEEEEEENEESSAESSEEEPQSNNVVYVVSSREDCEGTGSDFFADSHLPKNANTDIIGVAANKKTAKEMVKQYLDDDELDGYDYSEDTSGELWWTSDEFIEGGVSQCGQHVITAKPFPVKNYSKK